MSLNQLNLFIIIPYINPTHVHGHMVGCVSIPTEIWLMVCYQELLLLAVMVLSIHSFASS